MLLDHSLRSRRLEVVGTKKKRAREKETREGRGERGEESSLTPCVSPSRAPVLSFARYFQAPATQANSITTTFTSVENLSLSC